MTGIADEPKIKGSSGRFSELLKVEGKLAFREPYGLAAGLVFPVILLVIFGLISGQVGTVADTGLSVIDLYIPTIIVIGFIMIAMTTLPNKLVRDREIGWLRRVSTTPVHPSRLLAAQMILNLVIAVVMVVTIIFGGELVFGAPLTVGIAYFTLSLVLSIAVIFSLGLVLAAIAPTQTVGSALGGVFTFGLLFLSGLWIQPTQVGGALQTIMYYSPSGAAVEALLYSVFNATPPYEALVTMAAYTVIFSLVAIRFFRWE